MFAHVEERFSLSFQVVCLNLLQVVFKPTPEVWGYFSVKGGGGIHEYSDSQVPYGRKV